MSGKTARHSPSSSSPTPQHASKLPKFLQKQANRDRSRSVNEGASSHHEVPGSIHNSFSTDSAPTPSSSRISRKSGKFMGLGRDKEASPTPSVPETPDSPENEETPVIVEPVAIPRPRTRSERPASDVINGAQTYSGAISSTSSSNIGGLPTRLSGWFSHTFSSSTTDLSLPTLLAQGGGGSPGGHAPSGSPKGKLGVGSSALLTAAKHGKGHLDKAVRYLLDSDSMPDKRTDPIWLLGVQHTGYEPPPMVQGPPSAYAATVSAGGHRRRGSLDTKRRGSSTGRASTDTEAVLSQSQPPSSTVKHPSANWPPVFYADFTSRIWLTYRSQFPPIKDGRLADLCGGADFTSLSNASTESPSPSTSTNKKWHWNNLIGGEKEWSSDSGWGCMLRTGQSLLANSLLHLHLGRDWRVPPYPLRTADYATYVEILTWFFDTPAPEAPFSVHRMALAGKELGTDVGQWFGPSIAAGAIKALTGAFPEGGLGVSIASDGQCLYQTDVFAASHGIQERRRYPHSRGGPTSWGDRPVLLLIGTRLGLNGVNPMYYDTIKALYTFPQSVGIAGGRPSSSYYFVGSQADNLFYLDPHHARPAIPLRPPPPSVTGRARTSSPDSSDRERERDRPRVSRHGTMKSSSSSTSSHKHQQAPTSPSSIRTGSSTFSTFSYHAPASPSPLQQVTQNQLQTPQQSQRQYSSRTSSSEELDDRDLVAGSSLGGTDGQALDPIQEHYVTAYSVQELRTFHCERVRKMPLSGLDPSMLIGFLCRDQADWEDFRWRVSQLPKSIFSVQDEPPKWPNESDDSIGLESMSDPEDSLVMPEEDDEDDDGFEASDEKELPKRYAGSDRRSGSASVSSASQGRRSKSEEIDTEEDPVDPITPGPGSRFEIDDIPQKAGNPRQHVVVDDESLLENDDDWIETPVSPPRSSASPSPHRRSPSPPTTTPEPFVPPPVLRKEAKEGLGSVRRKKAKKQVPVPVPVVRISEQEHYAFPVIQRSAEDGGSREASAERRMHTARARDGGRTQSGGVRGILTSD